VITANFRGDLLAHIDAHFRQLGYKSEAAGDARENLPRYLMLLLRALRRVPDMRPRRAVLAPGFEVPVPLQNGFRGLLRAVESGASLRPWLTTRVDYLHVPDALLDDWGIHHFHLGTEAHPTRAGFVARTDEIAFAIVRPDAVYFLVATSHGRNAAPHVWTKTELMEIVHRHWPQLFEGSRVQVSGLNLTAEDHARFRKYRTNVVLTMSDGTVYYPPGGGLMSNGESATDYTYQMQLLRQIGYLQSMVELRASEIRARVCVRDNAEVTLKARYLIEYPEGFAIELFDTVSGAVIRFDGDEGALSVLRKAPANRRS